MTLFWTLFFKLIPLYFMVFLGYLSAQKLQAQKETIGSLLIYIIAPVVIFFGTYTAELTLANLSLSVLCFVLACLIGALFLCIGGFFFQDATKNILAFTAGTGNTGYFGLPVVLTLFGEEAFSLAVLCILGFVLYENSVGFYFSAKGNYSAKESWMKVVKLPTVYAFFFGILFNYLQIDLGDIVTTTIDSFKGAYTLLGMMIIGMGLSSVSVRQLDFTFLGITFFAKFIFWPVVMMTVIWLDSNFFQIYSQDIYNILIMMSIVPLASNTVAVATELNVKPGKAAWAVLLSTLFVLVYIPLMTTLFIQV